MTYEEVVRRVFSARDTISLAGGTNFEAWVVYVSPEDLADIKSDRAMIESGRFLPEGVFEVSVIGLPIRPDRSVRNGEVRLRAEVAA